jgi:pyruvate,water dikinase
VIRALSSLRSSDAGAFGGKSASLGELLGAGIPVPPGFGVSVEAFAAPSAVDDLLAGLDPADTAAVNAASRAIATAMRNQAFPDELRDSLAAVLGEGAHAVRSSAIGEDSADATFAGQQETFLWVLGLDAVCDAIRECWISLYSPPAITYRARLAAGGQVAMGVTVQEMVDAEVAGVMFTCSPTSGDPSVVAVNSSWGLGLGVVGGDVTPDEFTVSKVTGEVLKTTIGDKAIEYVPAERGTRVVDVSEERRAAPSLSEDRLTELIALGKRVQAHFGSAQDIEWAFARGSGELFVVQSRPVTVAAAAGSDAVRDRTGSSSMSLLLGTFGVKR